MQASLDELARMREQVVNGRRVPPARAMLDRLQSLGRSAGRSCASRGTGARRPHRRQHRTARSPPAARRRPRGLRLTDADTASGTMLAKFNAELLFTEDRRRGRRGRRA